MGVKFWHTHFSSRYSRSATGLEDLLDANAEHTDLYTVTEVDNKLRAATLREEGWSVSIPRPNASPRDDCGQAWLRTVFTCIHKQGYMLSGKQYIKDTGGLAAATVANFVVLELDNFHRALSAVAHLGHGVEKDLSDRRANSHNARVYVADLKALIDKAEIVADKYDCDSILLTFDGNLNVRLMWVRLFFRAKAKGYKINWQSPYPKKGTFGNRVIDITLYRGKIKLNKGPRLVSQQGTSDHAYGYTEEYEAFA